MRSVAKQSVEQQVIPNTCPFCCNKHPVAINYNGWKIYCEQCGIKTPDGYRTEKDAWEFWNRRK